MMMYIGHAKKKTTESAMKRHSGSSYTYIFQSEYFIIHQKLLA